MKAIIALLLASALVAGLADDAAAQEQAGKQKAHAKKRARSPEGNGNAGQQRNGDYVEHLADKMRFGSSEWWAQMMREQRLGGETQ